MTHKIQCILVIFYIVLTITSLIEKMPAKALYWFGALILTIGVLLMK